MNVDPSFLPPPPPIPPKRHVTSEEELTQADLAYIGWAVTNKARREAIAFNHPVAIGKDGWVVDVYPDGREVRVKPYSRPTPQTGNGENAQ